MMSSFAHCCPLSFSSFFFFNDTATTEIYTLSLHDALPIYPYIGILSPDTPQGRQPVHFGHLDIEMPEMDGLAALRSEEHTSELQSQSNLVCRLLLEKKKKKKNISKISKKTRYQNAAQRRSA